MESQSVTYEIIKNRLCIVCGAGFPISRVGKLYCSGKCKQFAFYHKDQIKVLLDSGKGIDNSIIELRLKDYQDYKSIYNQLTELSDLRRRKDSTWRPFEPFQVVRLQELENSIPNYLKKLKLPQLSIEEWSFLKILYHNLQNEDFHSLISSLASSFYRYLAYVDSPKNLEKIHPVQLSYNNHLLKIVQGKVLFI